MYGQHDTPCPCCGRLPAAHYADTTLTARQVITNAMLQQNQVPAMNQIAMTPHNAADLGMRGTTTSPGVSF